MKNLSPFTDLLRGIFYWISPPICVLCGRPIPQGDFICSDCKKKLKRYKITTPRCHFCGGPLIMGKLCPFCHGKGLPIDRMSAPFWYQGKVIKIVESFKYGGVKGLASFISQEMADYLQEFPDIDYLVPIPLHPVRKRERGFSQTELLSRKLSLYSGIPLLNALIRVKNTKSQTILGKAERKENLKNAFSLNPKNKFKEGSNMILIDDVLTTGSTMAEAAKVLKKGGAKKVYGLLFAIAP